MEGMAGWQPLAQLWGGPGMLRAKPGSSQTSVPQCQPSLTHPELLAKLLPGPALQPLVTPSARGRASRQ